LAIPDNPFASGTSSSAKNVLYVIWEKLLQRSTSGEGSSEKVFASEINATATDSQVEKAPEILPTIEVGLTPWYTPQDIDIE